MFFKIVNLVVITLLLSYSVFFNFRPKKFAQNKFLRVSALITAIFLLIYNLLPEYQKYCNYTYAYVSKDGVILKSRNFPWAIKKKVAKDGNISFVVEDEELSRPPSDFLVYPDDDDLQRKISLCYDGICIKFSCTEENLTNFKIEVHN